MKKRILCLTLSLALLLCLLPVPKADAGGGAASLYWIESFDNPEELSRWTILDANNDGYTFSYGWPSDDHDESYARSGQNVGGSDTDRLLSDDWLISPVISLGGGEYHLMFQVSGWTDRDSWVPYEVYIYTGSQTLTAANVRTTLTQPFAKETWSYSEYSGASWRWVSYDLTAYAGQQIRVAFRHCSEDAGVLCLDEVKIYWNEPDELLDKVTAFDVPEPAAGKRVADCRESAITFDENANYELIPGSLTYYRSVDESLSVFTGTFAYGEEYMLSFLVRATNGCETTDTGHASVNGRYASFQKIDKTTAKVFFYTGWLREPLNSVSLLVEQPVGGEIPFRSAYGYNRAQFSASEVSWHEISDKGILSRQIGDYETFVAGRTYRARVRLTPKDKLVLTGRTTATINGAKASLELDHYGNAWYTVDLKALSPSQVKTVSAINLKVPMPKPGQVFRTGEEDVTITVLDADPHWALDSSAWYYESGIGDTQIVFEAGVKYYAELYLRAAPGWKLTGDTVVKINGKPAAYYGQTNVKTWVACTEPRYVGNPFKDVPEDKYYRDPVLWAYYHDPRITSGTSDTTFSPNASCTRAQVMTFLWNLAGAPAPGGTENPFKDVKPGKWYTNPVLWAYYHSPQITGGKSATTFGTNEPCTRAQVVTFLWKLAGEPEPNSASNPFKDVKSDKYYYKAVLWAVENGVTSGISPNSFGPNNNCTRAQVVTFLCKADQVIYP